MRDATQQSFDLFVRESWASLFKTACLLTGDPREAEDVLQEALERTLRRWGRTEILDPAAYVRTAMVNAMRSRWRPRRYQFTSVAETPHPVRTHVDGTDVLGQRDQLFRVLRQITPKQRAVVVFRYWHDLSEAQTAEIVGCSVGTVKSQAFRGLQQLRILLHADDLLQGVGTLPVPMVPGKGRSQ